VAGTDLAEFVPRLTVEMGEESGDRYVSLDGSLLSADISGFTALSERLAEKGKSGAEEITDLINRCFSVLIECGHGYDGEVLKFGGDAILVLFRGDEHETRAGSAGLGMQEALRSLASARRSGLTMTVGVDVGPFDAFLVGSQHRELLISGAAASRVIELEGRAAKGGTLMGSDLASALAATLADVDGGGLITGKYSPTKRPVGSGTLDAYVPRAVAQQLAAFREAGGEHRIASIGFVMVSGVHELLDKSGGQVVAGHLGEVIDHTVDACRRFGASLLHSDIANDGAKLVIAAGAPITMGYDEDALLQVALAITELDSPFDIRVGAQRGRVFAGYLGSIHRRTYTVMGDPVNTAARLLGRAQAGDVVATDLMVDSTATIFKGHTLEPFSVKGKTEKLHAQVVERATGEAKGDVAPVNMVGRAAEIARVRQLLGVDGGVVEVLGSTGSGKTRLIHEAITSSTDRTIVRHACRTYDAATPYAALQPFARALTAIEAWATREEAGAALSEFVAEHCAHLGPWLPLLATVADAEVPMTPEVAALDAQFRRSRLEAIFEEFMVAVETGPRIYFLDDTQWLDDASADLLTHLVTRAGAHKWTIITASHLDPKWRTPDLPDTLQITIEPLSADALENIVVEASNQALSDHEIAAVIERCGGSPLYAIELARAVSIDGEVGLPESIEELVSRRIDALTPDNRRLVRLAAVLGTEFQTSDLAAVTGVSSVGETLQSPDLVGILQPRNLGSWGFTQSLFRDTAYEGLTFAERKRLHARIGEHFEATLAEVDDPAALLSLHFSEARQHVKAWKWSVIAADGAAGKDAHVEAVAAYGRALAAGRWAKVGGDERADIAVRMGDSAERCGRYEQAREAYTKARKLYGTGNDSATRLFRKQGVVCERQGDYRQALSWYSRGRKANVDGDELTELELAVAGIHFRQGLYRQSWDECEPIATSKQASAAARVRAHYIMQSAGMYVGHKDTAAYGASAIELVDRVDDSVLQANLFNNLGVVAYYAGDWRRAAELWQRSFELLESCGDVAGAVMSLNNIGEIRSDQRRFDDASEYFESALRRGKAASYSFAVIVLQSNLGRLAVRRGDVAAGESLIRQALSSFEELGSAAFAIETQLRLVEARLAAGDDAAARDEAQLLLADKDVEAAGPTVLAPLRRLLGEALANLGWHAEAEVELLTAIDLARENNLRFDLALALAARAQLDGLTADDQNEASALFAQLEVQ